MSVGHEEMWDKFRQARVCICDGWADVDGCDNGHGTFAEHVASVGFVVPAPQTSEAS